MSPLNNSNYTNSKLATTILNEKIREWLGLQGPHLFALIKENYAREFGNAAPINFTNTQALNWVYRQFRIDITEYIKQTTKQDE